MINKGYNNLDKFRVDALKNTGVSFCTRNHFGTPKKGEEGKYIRLAYSGISRTDIKEGLNKFKPDLIVSHSTATFGIFITYMVAKRLNINFVNLRYTKIDNYITFAKDNKEKYENIKKTFSKGAFSNKNISTAKKFI